MSLTERQRETYEKILLAKSIPEKAAVVENDLTGDDQKKLRYWFKLAQGQAKATWSAAERKEFDSWYGGSKHGLEHIDLLLRYETAGTEAKRKEIMNEIASIVGLSPTSAATWDYRKPFNHEYSQGASSGNIEAESDSEEEKKADPEETQKATLPADFLVKDPLKNVYDQVKAAADMKTDDKTYLERQHYSILSNMETYLMHEIDFSKFKANAVYDFAATLTSRKEIAGIQSSSFIAKIKKAIQQKQNDDKYNSYRIDSAMCKAMTIQQLVNFKSCDDSNVITALFKKKYSDDITKENVELMTNEEKYANVLKLYNAAKDDGQPQSFQMGLLAILLAWGPKAQIYDKELFKKLIEYTEVVYGGGGIMKQLGKAFKNKFIDKHQHENWGGSFSSLSDGLDSGVVDPQTIARNYLENFAFANNGDLSEFKKKDQQFLTVYMIDEIESRVQVYLSRNGVKGVKNDTMTQDRFQQMCEEVDLSFRPENKDKFKPNELVELWLDIKNVDAVHVRVFEFNTETYYRKNLKPFDTTVDLDGLEAKMTQKHEYKEPKNVKLKRNFTFPELNNRVGLFIVDFQGNGRSARAVIKKGSLSLIHRSTEAGHQAYIIDDDRKICKGKDRVGLWMSNKWYEAKPDSGVIFIPYGKSEQSLKVIMQNADFAQLGEFKRKTESYRFESSFFVDGEQLIMGNNAQVIISPQLYINDRSASLTLLKNVNVSLTTQNYIDSIPVTKKMDGINLVDGQELTVEFQVPPNLESIKIVITAQVTNATTKEVQSFRKEHSILHTKQETCEVYLRQVKGDAYELMCLGINGEPRPDMQFDFRFEHSRVNNVLTKSLTTDRHGKCYLGKLFRVVKLNACCSYLDLWRTWDLTGTKTDFWKYPSSMNLLQGDSFSIPISEMWDPAKPNELKRQQITFYRSIEGEVTDDCFAKLKLVKAGGESTHYFLLQAENLEPGEYVLKTIGENNFSMHIRVHKGQIWNNVKNFIQKQACIQEIMQSQKMVKIVNSTIEKGVHGQRIKLQLADFTKDARVHLFATKFYQPDYTPLYSVLCSSLSNKFDSNMFSFAKWSNMHMSNRTLGDEYRYVFDRKEAERQLGNTLDRPQLLNKRLFTRKTEMDQENLSSGDQFQKVEEQMMMQNIMPMSDMVQSNEFYSQNIMPSSKRMMSQQQHTRASSYSGQSSVCEDGSFTFSEVQNFLKNTPLHAYNLKPDAQGNVNFASDKLGKYSTIIAVAVDNGSAAQHIKNLGEDPAVPIPMRDLRLKKIFDHDKGLTQTRVTNCLIKGEKDFIEDITSAEVQIIDDLKKVKEVLHELNQQLRVTQHDSFKKFAKLDFIFKWNRMTKDEKEKHLSEFFSHEFNFFLKKKDPEFFEGTVRGILSSKMEKTLVDFYLLDMHEQVFSSIEIVNATHHLNAFELCLYIDSLIQLGKKNNDASKIKLAKALATVTREKQTATDEMFHNQTAQNMVFDLVLNLNSLSKDNKSIIASQHEYDSEEEEEDRSYGGGGGGGGIESFLGGNNYRGGGGGGGGEPPRGPPPPSMQSNNGMFSNMMPQSQMIMAQSQMIQAPQMQQQQQQNVQFNANFMDNDLIDMPIQEVRNENFNREEFEQMESTSEYMETHYYNSKLIGGADAREHIEYNMFWSDYALFLTDDSKTQFVSENFTYMIKKPIQSFMALCILDLPFQAESQIHTYQSDEATGQSITAGSNAIFFKKEIKEVEVQLKQNFIVTHRYKKVTGHVDDEEAIPDAFLINTPYLCEVIMTNVSPGKQKFNLLYQIPAGSMPMGKTRQMMCKPFTLKEYSTERTTFQFYFPSRGKCSHYPSSLSIDGKVTARGEFNELNVVKKRKVDVEKAKRNFDDLVQIGTKEQILDFCQTENILAGPKGFSVSKILFLCKELDFWTNLMEILRTRQMYYDQVWMFALYHQTDLQAIKEYMNKSGKIRLQFPFKSTLVAMDGQFEPGSDFAKMLEYNPMINARAHKIGQSGRHQILNKTFRQTYDRFLIGKAIKPEQTFEDKMVFVYYLQLQDRINEAIDIFETIKAPEPDPDNPNGKSTLLMQYDYLSAYFDFFTGANESPPYRVARRIVQEYDNHPVSHWRMMFMAIQDQLDEFDGEFDNEMEDDDSGAGSVGDGSGTDASLRLQERKKANMKASLKREPNISNIDIDDKGEISIESVNIKEITLNYYIIDAEILFSRQPFLKDNAEQFSYVKPFSSIKKAMLGDGRPEDEEERVGQYVTEKIPLPENLLHRNLVIEITGEDQQHFKTFYSSNLKVSILESFGELKVTHKETGKALPEIYVKVFALNKNGGEKFYKDGYTDIRGLFEYAQTSGDKLKKVKKFAIYIESKQFGSQIREVDPPRDESGGGSGDVEAQGSLQARKYDRMYVRNRDVQTKKMQKAK